MEGTESVVVERTAPSPEVLERPGRRRFTVEYKAKILAETTRRGRPGRADAQASRSQGEAEEPVGR